MNLLEQWRALEPYIITAGGTERAAAVVCIVVVWVTAVLPRKWIPKFRYRLLLGLLLLTVSIGAVYWETIAIARQAKYLCENEAGIKVFRTVEANGFLGASDIENWSRYGFDYVEKNTLRSGKVRSTMMPTSKPLESEINRESVDEFISEYEFVGARVRFPPCCGGARTIVRVIATGEVLGQATSINIDRSTLDRFLVPRGDAAPLRCNGPERPSESPRLTASSTAMIRAVIKPVGKIEE